MGEKKYQYLMLDIKLVEEKMEQWCEKNIDDKTKIDKNENDNQILYTIIGGGKEVKIILYKARGGAFTISPNTGKEKEISTRLADYIVESCSPATQSPYAHGFSIKIQYEDYKALLDILKNFVDIRIENSSIYNEPGKAQYEQHRLCSDKKDSVVLKYYINTGTLQVQGKPRYLFHTIIALLTECEKSAEAVVDAHIELCQLDINKEEIEEELLDILDNRIYDYLTFSHRALLKTSFVLCKMRVNGLDDYSYVLMEALRAYEGFFEKMMIEAGISFDYINSNGEQKRRMVGHFYEKSINNVDYVMKNRYTSGLSSIQIDTFEKMYNYYNRNRNPYMHATESDVTTTLIPTFEAARDRLNDLVLHMKTMFYSLNA